MEIINIENVKLRSVNNKFGHNPKTNKLYLNKEYRDFKDLLIKSCVKERIEPPYLVLIMIVTHLDIDNCIKVILDALETSGVIDNDKNVLHLDVFKQPIPRNKLGSLKVNVMGNIEELDQWKI